MEHLTGQSFDWNIRAGINIMDSKTSGKDVAVLFHAGGEAGVRITNFAFYGELLYSQIENQYGGDPVSYFVPSAVMKAFMRKILFAEMGAGVLIKTGDSGVTNDTLNPDGTFMPFAGLGIHVFKIDLSFRSHLSREFPIIQATLAAKF